MLLFWSTAVGAQTATTLSLNSLEIPAVRTAKPPVIDGRIEDEEWSAAALVTGFVQYEPRRGDESDVRTEVLALYDAAHFYVAFRAWDTEPVTAQLTQRDADLFTDDAVAVVLDTTFDRRSGYYFITNALGTQADGRIADDGRIVESTWDAPWQSAARRTDYGWSAEFSIPLSSIRYAAGKNQVWGINFGRSRRRTLETSFWSGPLDSQIQPGIARGGDSRSKVPTGQRIQGGNRRVQNTQIRHRLFSRVQNQKQSCYLSSGQCHLLGGI